MSVMGVKIDQFDSPICNTFRDKILQDQLCYSVDPNEFRKSIKDEMSLTLFINYNEDRKIKAEIDLTSGSKYALEEHYIFVGTIGKIKLYNLCFLIYFKRTNEASSW